MPDKNLNKKPTLVMLPGLDGTGLLLQPAAQAAKQHFNTKVIDYPHEHEPGDVYKQLLPYIKEKLPKEGEFFLLGESFGGPLAAALIADDQLKDRIAGVCFCVTFTQNPFHFPVPHFFKFVNESVSMRHIPEPVLNYVFASAVPGQTPKSLEVLHEVKGILNDNTIRQRINSVLSLGGYGAFDETYKEKLSEYKGKVVYFAGEKDYLIPAHNAHHVQKALPQTEVFLFESSHLLLQSLPEESMNHLAKCFLEMKPKPKMK